MNPIPKTAFTSPFRKYEYVKVPFGLAQAPAYCPELMTGVLKDLPLPWLTLMTSSCTALPHKKIRCTSWKMSRICYGDCSFWAGI